MYEDETPPTSWQEARERPVLRPPVEMFDPDKLSHWSITMTMAWIIWADIAAVREQWDDYRSQCAEWRFFPDAEIDAKVLEIAIKNATLDEPAPNDPEIDRLGKKRGKWKFAAWSPAGWYGLEFRCRRHDIPWEDMVVTLWQAAGEGQIKATALECRGELHRGQVIEIPPHMWDRLRRTEERSGKTMLSAPDRDYRDVKFSRLEVKSLWPLKKTSPPEAETAVVVEERPRSKSTTNNGRGRPKEYKWDTEIKDFALDLVEKFGVPGENNKKLPRQEDLVVAVQDELAKKDLHPGVSTVRRYVARWLRKL